MRKWLAVLLVVPLLGCGHKGDSAGVSKTVAEEVAEARELIDDVIVTFGYENAVGKTGEEIDHEEQLIEDIDESLGSWNFDFDERAMLSRLSTAFGRVWAAEEQYEDFQNEFEDDFFSDSMNYVFRTSLMFAFESYLEEFEGDSHQEIVDLRESGHDLEAGEHYRHMAQTEIRVSEIFLKILEDRRTDLIGDKEDGLFTTRDLQYLNRHYELIAMMAPDFIEILDELDELTEAQNAWQ
ncbi:MAG: hypothetical protein IH944_01550 [Armatimonadetes bacterium]|nr:hypothetical protein [Armatimonadota bacterium]